MLRENDSVRIVRLLKPSRAFVGTDGTKRPPAVGDVGAIVHQSEDGVYVVEMVDGGGNTVWLADFEPEELKPLAR